MLERIYEIKELSTPKDKHKHIVEMGLLMLRI